MYLKLFICTLFGFSSAFGATTTLPEGFDAGTAKMAKAELVKIAKDLNGAKTLKGYIGLMKKKAAPGVADELNKIYTDAGAEPTAKISNCTVKDMSISCGGQVVEIISSDKVKINGTHEYTMNPDKNILDVTRDIIQIVQAKPEGNSGLFSFILPEASADWFDPQGMIVGAAAVGLIWLLFGRKKDKQANVTTTTTTNNYYYGYGGGPMPMMAKPGSKSLNRPHTSR